jgi:hypothetical protein
MWLKITNFKTTQGTFSASWLSRVLETRVLFPNYNQPLIEIPDFVEGDIQKLFDNGIVAEKYAHPGIIPGHMKAHTWVQTLVIVSTAYGLTGRFATSLFGALAISLGEFYGNQATHLARHTHEPEGLTPVELWMIRRPIGFRIFGLILLCLGLLIAFFPSSK